MAQCLDDSGNDHRLLAARLRDENIADRLISIALIAADIIGLKLSTPT